MRSQRSPLIPSGSRQASPAFQPALLTSTSSRPSATAASSTAGAMAAGSLWSSWIIAVRRPRFSTWRHVSLAPSRYPSHVTATSAPAPASATAMARPRSPEPPVTSAPQPVSSTRSAHRRERRHAELARTLAEPLEHFPVQRDAPGAALLQLLGLRQPGIEDALLPGRRRRPAERLEHPVHRVLELLDVGERLDVVRREVVLRSAAGGEHRGQRAGQHGGEDLGHEGEAVALVRALLARAPERELVVLVAVEDGLLLRDRVALLVRDPAGH